MIARYIAGKKKKFNDQWNCPAQQDFMVPLILSDDTLGVAIFKRRTAEMNVSSHAYHW